MNQLKISYGNDLTLALDEFVDLLYDGATQRWRNVTQHTVPGTVWAFAGTTLPAGWKECDGSAVSRTTFAGLFEAIGLTWGSGDGSTTFNLPQLSGRSPIGAGTGTVTENVAAASVSTAADTWTVGSNNARWITGMKVQVSSSGTLPAPLTASTDYWLIRSSATTIKFASTLADAVAGSAINLTSQGTGTHIVTHTLTARTLSEVGGDEGHALTIAEIPAHDHGTSGSSAPTTGGGTANRLNASAATTDPTGGSGSHNNMQPFAAVRYMIKV